MSMKIPIDLSGLNIPKIEIQPSLFFVTIMKAVTARRTEPSLRQLSKAALC